MSEIRVYVVEFPDRKNLVMRYRCPETGRSITKTAGTTHKREAVRAAARWEAEINAGDWRPSQGMGWDAFRDYYEACGMTGLKVRTQKGYTETLDAFERICRPIKVSCLTTAKATAFSAEISSSDVAAYPDSVGLGLGVLATTGYGRLQTAQGETITMTLGFGPTGNSNISATLTELVPGDFNDSGKVGAEDYTVWRDVPGFLAPLLTDYDVWHDNYGAMASSESQSVPEPSTGILLALGLAILCLRPNCDPRCDLRRATNG